MNKPKPELIKAFLDWFSTAQHAERENKYAGTMTQTYLSGLSKTAFIDFFTTFVDVGGHVQSGGYRSTSRFKKTIQSKYKEFREFALEPFTPDFNEIEWLRRINNFSHFGIGIATIYLNRIDKHRYAIINNKAVKAVKLFGVRVPISKAKRYEAVRDAWKLLMEWHPEIGNYFRADALSQFLIGESIGEPWRAELEGITGSGIHKTLNEPMPLNIILYGPPGTGKTYTLRNEYMSRFTEPAATLSKDVYAAELVADLSWWQVSTIVMLDLKKSKVDRILAHPLMQARVQRSSNRHPRAAIWAHLQMHTKTDCPTVNYAKRFDPLLFEKNQQSVWTIDEPLANEMVPDLVETLRRYRKFSPERGVSVRRYDFVTFHQSYSYEDFVEGIKPVMSEDVAESLSYEIKPGIFKTMVERSLADPDHEYALLIDEISRGNVANIFGELIALIENDKRKGQPNELSAKLPYSRDLFVVPPNLHIIGAMNTADRSVEALDTALRRRFTFIAFHPRPDLIEQPAGLAIDLRTLLTTINRRIERLLDKDHCIGHSYFMGLIKSSSPLEALCEVFATKIIPLLEEHFYGDPGKVGMILGERFVVRTDGDVSMADGDWGVDEYEKRPVFVIKDAKDWTAADFRTIYE